MCFLYDEFSLYGLHKERDLKKSILDICISPMFMMNMAMTAENLKRNSPDDEELQRKWTGF